MKNSCVDKRQDWMERFGYNDLMERQIYRFVYREICMKKCTLPNQLRFQTVADWKQYVIDNWITKEPDLVLEFYEQMCFEQRKRNASAPFLPFGLRDSVKKRIDRMFYNDYLEILQEVLNQGEKSW